MLNCKRLRLMPEKQIELINDFRDIILLDEQSIKGSSLVEKRIQHYLMKSVVSSIFHCDIN